MIEIGPNMADLVKDLGSGAVFVIIIICLFGNPFK